MVVNYSSVEMTGNYSQNIQQNIIELTLGTRGKHFTRRYFEIFCQFFPELWQYLFSGTNKEIIKLLSAEYSQRVVMVKDKPYSCMCEKWSNTDSYQKI